MDQAASLRELMNKIGRTQRSHPRKGKPFAVMSLGAASGIEVFLKRYVVYLSKCYQKQVGLLGVPERKQTEIRDYLFSNAEEKELIRKLDEGVSVVPGDLAFVGDIRENHLLCEKFLRVIKKMENKHDVLLYYAGDGVHPTSVNLSLLSNTILLVMKPDAKSVMDACSLMKVFGKKNEKKTIGIVVDTYEQACYEKQIKKIQEMAPPGGNYKIVPIGYFDLKYATLFTEEELFAHFTMNPLMEENAAKETSEMLSHSLYRILG
jgi:hypothetical protein